MTRSIRKCPSAARNKNACANCSSCKAYEMLLFRTRIAPQELGIALFEITVDDQNHIEAMKQLSTFPEPVFEMPPRDLTLFSALLPQLSSYPRGDLRVFRVELMFFVFAWIDYLFMRSELF